MADITGIEIREGDGSRLSAIADIFSRLVVGSSMGKERDEQLVTKAGVMALEQRHPLAGLVDRSDRGRRVF
ncbi:MAG TPA: hypothetical protein VGL94_15370 [Ktedonobacteraceae bacterium]